MLFSCPGKISAVSAHIHPELLQEPVRLAPVHAHLGHRLAHGAARLVPDAGAPGVQAGTLGPHAHGAVHGAGARARRRARGVNFSDGVHEAVVVDAPLPPVVPELVVRVAFGRRIFRGDSDLQTLEK